MQTVTHDGRETAYRFTNPDETGPTILYVHGSGGNHQAWVRQYAPQALGYPSVALDLSGHGHSEDIETEPGPETLAAYARDVTAVARETDADVLVGNSLGGAVVFEVILSDLFDPAAAVFVGTGAKLAVNEQLRTLLSADFEAAVEQLHQPSMLFASADERTLERSKAAMREAGQRVTRRDFLTCHQFDVRDRLGAVDVPSLAVVGEHDRLTPPEYHTYLAENLPDCEYACLEGGGHLVMLEQHEAFNSCLGEFTENVVIDSS